MASPLQFESDMLTTIDHEALSRVNGGNTITTTDTDTGVHYGNLRVGARTHQVRDDSDYAICINAAVATHQDIAKCGLPSGSRPAPTPLPAATHASVRRR